MKIGVSGPFTGKRSAYGDLIKARTRQIAEEMNLEDKVNFAFIDDKAQVSYAMKAAKTFIEEKVDAVIGHFNSECAKNVAKEYHKNQMLFVAPASTAVQIPYENEGYVYRTCPNNKDQIHLIKKYILKNKILKLGIIQDDTPYSDELSIITKKVLGKIGVEIFELKECKSIEDIDTYWFLGTHYFCMEKAMELLKTSKLSTMLFCDDCYIGEFINHFTNQIYENNLLVVGLMHEDGFGNCYKKALESLILLLFKSKPFKVEKENWKLYKI